MRYAIPQLERRALCDEEVLSSVVFGANGKVLLAQIVHN